MIIFVFDRVENFVETEAFSPFPTMFSKLLCFKVVKTGLCGKQLKLGGGGGGGGRIVWVRV